MIIRKPRPLPVRLLREFFYFFYNPAKKIYWFFFKPQGEGVKSFIFNGNKILLVKIGYAHKSWVLPGGAVDRGETAEVAAARETFEESGIEVADLVYVGKKQHSSEYKRVTLHFYYGTTAKEDIIIDDQEIIDAGWFDLASLPKPRRKKLDDEIRMYNEWKHEK